MKPLKLPISTHQLKPDLRNQEEGQIRLEMQVKAIRKISQLLSPFLCQCYSIQKDNDGWKIQTSKENNNILTYLSKQQPIKTKIQLAIHLLSAIQQLNRLGYGLICLPLKDIQVTEEGGLKLPIHNCWQLSADELLGVNKQYYMMTHKEDHAVLAPQMHSKEAEIKIMGMQMWAICMVLRWLFWKNDELKVDYLAKGTPFCLQEIQWAKTRMPLGQKLNGFWNEKQCMEAVQQNLSFLSVSRTTTIERLLECFEKAFDQTCYNYVDMDGMRKCLDGYAERKVESVSAEYRLMTEDLENKLIGYFESKKKKVSKPSVFQPVYKGSVNGFSSKVFHQKCDTIKNLITVFQTVDGSKFCGYSPVAFDMEVLLNVFGTHIADESGESFIFSVNHGEFFNLKDKSKAIGVAPNYGPIYGNGDIVVYDGNQANYSKGAQSYQPTSKGFKGGIVNHEMFVLKQMEAYAVCFQT